MEAMSRDIHHYCSPSVFLSLMKNKELWLTSLTLSNDHAEGTWMLDHWLDTFNLNDPKQRLQRRGAYYAVTGVLNHNVALGTCFSEERDLLSQWRGYAQDGAGFSVTFERSGLESVARNFLGGAKLLLSKIAYGYQDNEEVINVVKQLSNAFSEDAAQYQEKGNGLGSMALKFTPEKHVCQRLAARQLFTIKNGAFKEEKEWRLFLFCPMSDLESIEFRESHNLLSPFVRFKIPESTILGVTLGPTNPTPESVVEAALKQNGINAWVRWSNASYRNR
jgi:hypothetical protein